MAGNVSEITQLYGVKNYTYEEFGGQYSCTSTSEDSAAASCSGGYLFPGYDTVGTRVLGIII